jgi:phage terminase large subunit-like protein
MRLFGWKRPGGLRRYLRAYLEIAKKNGKSTLLSAIGLYLLIADNEGSPEIYLNACDAKQAGIIFREQARMVAASPDLKKRLTIYDSATNRRVVYAAKNGAIIVNSSIAASKDGLNPSATIFDELHRQPTRALWEVFEYAGAAREQPLRLSITTAGEEEDGVWFEEREYAEQINAGLIDDITFLGVVYRALPTDDVDSPETWRKANPSLGDTISAEDFARELREAKAIPTKFANFRRLRLNIVCREATKFLEVGEWDRGGSALSIPADAHPGKFWAGLDLSSVSDLSALAVVWFDGLGVCETRVRFWLPADNIAELERKHRAPYRQWAAEGWITLTPGNVIDYAWIRREVKTLAAGGECRKLLADPHNALKLCVELREDDGVPVEFIRQGFISLNPPTKELQRLIMGGLIRHGGNPVLRWMAANAVAVEDAAGNIKLSKSKGRKKIDGMSALVNAIAAADGDHEPTPLADSDYVVRFI